ncbi:Choline dehydrogenase [Stigmatella aurantiaca]|uniref:Choline dehydrogenase n=1 Tax=Stigmatella aurantiaca TaxID=41 RepID=A0A1H8EHJ5_STIAU|nr:GMC family oxidoreductase [Stigmatella aurantiaca]SEN18860.1 Choline dehydrogenase [Stigmatella aurantiaca]
MSWVKSGYDVIIIGSGPGGSTLAQGLARRDCNVLVVEQGDFLRPETVPGSQQTTFIRDVQRRGIRSTVGGESKFYGAALYRLRESDFCVRSTDHGESPAWPLTYADLEPFYDEGERLYSVHGSPEGDPSEPPRSRPFPHGPIEHEPLISEVVERLKACGVPVGYIPKGIDVGPNGRCVMCSTCDGYYCHRDAKMDAEVAALRPALKTGRVELSTGTDCLKVLTTPDGRRATGVLLRRGSEEAVVHADVVVVSAGIRESPVLLWRSRSDAHPNGIGNAGGALGRYLAGHTCGFIFPFMGLRPIPALHQKTFAINAFYEAPADWPHRLGVIQATGQIPIWKQVHPLLSPFVGFVARRSLVCVLMTEVVGTAESGFTFSGEGISQVRNPEPCRETYRKLRQTAVSLFHKAGFRWVHASEHFDAPWHTVGTARIGTNPATSVLDAECRVHGLDNLYVVDASSLPTAGAVNTTLTIVAMALRAAQTIASGKRAPRAGVA